jgi:tripeptidyl-peptidase-1
MKVIQAASTLVIIATHCLIQCNGHLRSTHNSPIVDPLTVHVFREHSVGLSHPSIVKKDRVPSTQTHDVMFAIEQRNIEELTSILEDVSDPLSPDYGKHMTSQEVAALTANPASRDHVVAYLKAAGATIVSETLYGEFVRASAPVALWEEMFDTEFFTYSVPSSQDNGKESERSRKFVIRTDKYSVPMALNDHVNAVFNTIQTPFTDAWQPLPPKPIAPPSEKSGKFNAADTTGYIFPSTLINAYNIDNSLTHPRATQAVFEACGQSFSPADLTLFQTSNYLPLQTVNVSIGNHSVSSAACASNLGMCAEGNLDVQYLMAISKSPSIYYYTDLSGFGVWLEEVANLVNPPLVLSISWGSYETGTSDAEAFNFNVQAMKLGVMGVTILVATGDDGAANSASRYDTSYCGYYPSFPATSPYVTAVGATQVSLWCFNLLMISIHNISCSLYLTLLTAM